MHAATPHEVAAPNGLCDLLQRLDHAGGKPAEPSAAHSQTPARFVNRWQRAVYDGNSGARDELIDYRGTLAQYVKAYAFFSQILHLGDPRFEKFSVFADLLGRKLRDFSGDSVGKVDVDVSDVVLTHYKLEKLRDEQLELVSGEADGLRGMTEAGMARQIERERGSRDDIIEKVNKYFGDLGEDPQYSLDYVNNLFRETVQNPDVRAIASTNTLIDFQNSVGVLRCVEDEQWNVEQANPVIAKRGREIPARELLRLLIEMGLWEAAADIRD